MFEVEAKPVPLNTKPTEQTDGAPLEIISERLLIESDTPGIQLQLRHRRPAKQVKFTAERTLLLVHGATYASGSLFDVPLEGVSPLDFAARRGYDVYALDVRGYGGSTRPPEMSEPAQRHPPIVRTDTAVRDLSTAVDFLRERRQISQVNLLAMSWGGSVAGAYTARHNDKVRKLVLVAPLWIPSQRPRIALGPELGAYRTVSIRDAKERWLEPVPEDKRAALVPDGWFETWAQAAMADDLAAATDEGADQVRAPSGAVQDIRDYWMNGISLYDPARITTPVLLVHAAWDADVQLATIGDLFSKLTASPDRRWMEIAEGTHLVLLEKERWRAMRAVISFLNED